MTTNDEQYEAAYTAAYDRALRLCEQLSRLLKNVPAPDTHCINWGRLGDLNEVNKRLADVVRFLQASKK